MMQRLTVSASEVNTFTASINVSVSGLPAGVTANPATFSLTPGNQQLVTFNATATASAGTASITFQGTSGSLSHSARTSLSVVGQVTGAHPPIRTRYLRTSSFYDSNSLGYNPPHFTVYDAAHKQFFVSNPFLNEIDVFDAAQEIETAQIPIPVAWGLDVSPYNGSLYAGTLIGDVYQIDTSTLSVVTRYPAASIGPTGFTAQTALVLSDGRLALQGGSGEGVVLGVDGYGASAVWDPVTNSLDTGVNGSVCELLQDEGAFAVSGDRTRVLVASADGGVGGDAVCSYDPIAKVATYSTYVVGSERQIIPTPDGARFFQTGSVDVAVFDAKTLQLLGQFTCTLPNCASGAAISPDGATLYLVDASGAVAAWDTTSLTQKGWVPSFTVSDLQIGIVISAVDGSGLIVGPTGHGVGFIDASQMTAAQPSVVGSGYTTPATGPLAGNTGISITTGNLLSSPVLSNIYVGNLPGSSASFNDSQGHGFVVSPLSNYSGAVDLTLTLSDGGLGMLPEGFSYGPATVEVVPNGATADGGQTGTIIGYGFGSSASKIQVSVGGQPAAVTAVYPYAAPVNPYPFPVSAVQFTIPPGTAGEIADVTVTTASGSATAAGAFYYTAAVQSFPVTANLQEGIYDAGRDLYYFADQAKIQVLSKSSGQWLPPITLPGVTSKTQLLAISESPDGTKLAVSDYGDQTIYVLNPDNPASAISYPMSLDNDSFSADLAPSGLAVTNSGMVYFDTADINGTGTPLFHKLNTATQSITDLGTDDGLAGSIVDKFDRVLLSPDGSKVYSSQSGSVTNRFWLQTASDQVYCCSTSYLTGGSFPDVAVSGDGSTLDASGELTDPVFNTQVEVAYIDWETWFPFAADGQKLNHDGSILFQPLTDGVDMIARNTGRLLYRIQIPVTPANIYDALVVAEGQNTLAVITATGVSFVDLSSLPIPTGDTQPFPDTTHSKTSSLPDRQTIRLAKRALAPRSYYYQAARPKLRRRNDQSKAYTMKSQ